MKTIDLNVDIGEGFPDDEALLGFATSANVCCGEHAGSWELTEKTIELGKSKGKRIGMHPGFPDRANMGRVAPVTEEVEEWRRSLIEQTNRFCAATTPDYIKPHGAWYNILMARDARIVEPTGTVVSTFGGLFLRIAAVSKLPAMLMPTSPFREGMSLLGVACILEGFADRVYDGAGFLIPRSDPACLLIEPDAIREQVLKLAPEVDSLCLHGDTPGCVEIAELIYKTLVDAGFEVKA